VAALGRVRERAAHYTVAIATAQPADLADESHGDVDRRPAVDVGPAHVRDHRAWRAPLAPCTPTATAPGAKTELLLSTRHSHHTSNIALRSDMRCAWTGGAAVLIRQASCGRLAAGGGWPVARP